LKHEDFLAAAETMGINKKILHNTMELFKYAKPELLAVLDKSFVSDSMKAAYFQLFHQRYAQLRLD
jgi:serine/threonine-protein kinase HipA